MYRKFKADQLFDGTKFLEKDSILITTGDGTVHDIIGETEAGEGIEPIQGVLTPGLINAHCHLELSHLKNVIPPHTGLIDFLCSVVTKRDFSPGQKMESISKAEKEMDENGIVAVGDICNTADAIDAKRQSRICWNSFIEVISFTDANAENAIRHYLTVLEKHKEELEWPNQNVLTPHAPYSISPKTFEMLNEATSEKIISIHNQEHPAEDELYKTGGGDYLKLFSIFGVNKSPFPITCKSSIRSYLPHFNKQQSILLVHNTYMPGEDIDFANEYANTHTIELTYCICINANLYIENKTPPVNEFRKRGCRLVLGTDSYSSNWQLDICREMYTVQKNFPEIPLAEILCWATSNGATALGQDDRLGSFNKGKKPGLVAISGLENGKLSESSKARRIL